MKQEYHSNAVTNIHIRKQIQESSLKNTELAENFNTSVTTISKWKNSTSLQDTLKIKVYVFTFYISVAKQCFVEACKHSPDNIVSVTI